MAGDDEVLQPTPDEASIEGSFGMVADAYGLLQVALESQLLGDGESANLLYRHLLHAGDPDVEALTAARLRRRANPEVAEELYARVLMATTPELPLHDLEEEPAEVEPLAVVRAVENAPEPDPTSTLSWAAWLEQLEVSMR